MEASFPPRKGGITVKTVKYKVHGMHCASCEVLIEQKLKTINGIQKIKAVQSKNFAEITCTIEPNISEMNKKLKEHGYTMSPWDDNGGSTHEKTKYFEVGALFLIIFGAYLMLKKFNIAPTIGISENMNLGVVFVIGLVAAISSCIAVTGGLLLAVAAKYNEQNPGLTPSQKLKPHMYFNAGRIASYTVLGGATGAVGSLFTFSPLATGMLTIFASIVMIILGLQLLKIFPKLKFIRFTMPKFISHKIHDMNGRNQKSAPFFLGALTFFLPCGFTQALQLYVLSKGDPMQGALIMFIFSLGTLPALLSLSVISSFAKGKFQKHFLRFSGVVVILLGIFNIRSGLNLAGATFELNQPIQSEKNSIDPNVQLIDGKQIVNMKVDYIDYIPMQFTVQKGIPVEWRIDGRKAAGCVQVLNVPKLGITEYLPQDKIKIITFTPQETGEIKFRCAMGMTDPRAKFIVVDEKS